MPSITISWPDDTYEQDRDDFLLAAPNQTLDAETPLSDNLWVKKKIGLMISGEVMRGRRMRQETEAAVLTKPIIAIS